MIGKEEYKMCLTSILVSHKEALTLMDELIDDHDNQGLLIGLLSSSIEQRDNGWVCSTHR